VDALTFAGEAASLVTPLIAFLAWLWPRAPSVRQPDSPSKVASAPKDQDWEEARKTAHRRLQALAMFDLGVATMGAFVFGVSVLSNIVLPDPVFLSTLLAVYPGFIALWIFDHRYHKRWPKQAHPPGAPTA
jgi:hypothetical protein